MLAEAMECGGSGKASLTREEKRKALQAEKLRKQKEMEEIEAELQRAEQEELQQQENSVPVESSSDIGNMFVDS